MNPRSPLQSVSLSPKVTIQLVLPGFELYINGIVYYILLCVCLLLPHVTFVRVIILSMFMCGWNLLILITAWQSCCSGFALGTFGNDFIAQLGDVLVGNPSKMHKIALHNRTQNSNSAKVEKLCCLVFLHVTVS